MAAKDRAIAEIYAARRDAEEARDVAPGELADAVALLREVEDHDGYPLGGDTIEKVHAFMKRHPK